MRLLVQMGVVARSSLLTLPQRKGPALVIVICVACVTGVLLSVLSVTNGLLQASEVAGSRGRAIVFSTDGYPGPGGRAEESSHISQDDLAILDGAPGVKGPLAAESLAILPPVEGFAFGTLFVRGVGAHSLAMRPGFQLISGRLFQPGLHEIIVGAGAARVFGLNVGDRVIMPDGEWPIVGAFSAGGGILEGELMGDAATVMSAIQRTTNFSSVLVDLETPDAFDEFKRWITSNPALSLTAERQSDYYRHVARYYSGFFTAVAYVVGVIMALGAQFGSVKILHAALD
jgi:putative ABC transport system permease protein